MTDRTANGADAPVSVLIAGTKFSYPYEGGAATRVRAYARGLMESGARVHIVSLLTPPGDGDQGANTVARGVHEGVTFEYSCGTRRRAPSFLGRRLLELRSPLGLWFAASRFFAHQPGPKAILAYSDRSRWIVFTALLAHRHRAACILELGEMPFVYERGSRGLPLRRWIMHAVTYRFVDGFIAISTMLCDYARRHGRPQMPVAHVPILVAAGDFQQDNTEAASPREVVYVGDLRWRAVEAGDLLEAFGIVARQEPDVVLRLVGPVWESAERALRERAVTLGCGDRVLFDGAVTREALPGILGHATVLVLLRRSELFSQAGFPTKLGEYLASGRPVVVTATGDIPLHLTHEGTGYLVASANPEAFAEQVLHVLRNGEEARRVGARGRLLAERQFDYLRHGRRLIRFVADCHSATAGRDSRGGFGRRT